MIQKVCEVCGIAFLAKQRNRKHCSKKCSKILYFERNPTKVLEQKLKRKEWGEKNKEHLAEYNSKYHKEKAGKVAKRKRRYYDSNPEKKEARKKRREEWRKSNLHIDAASTRRRRAGKLNASPSWLSDEQRDDILKVYKLSSILQVITGDKHHVDHIVPLKGENICGLHVPWNLQVLPATLNIAKSNKEDWCEESYLRHRN